MDDTKVPQFSDEIETKRYEEAEEGKGRLPPYSFNDPRAPYSSLAASSANGFRRDLSPFSGQESRIQQTEDVGRIVDDYEDGNGDGDGGAAMEPALEKEQQRIDVWAASEEKRIAEWAKGERERAEAVRRKFAGDGEAEKIILRVEKEKMAAVERLKKEKMEAVERTRLHIGIAR